jgi:hypothetical protein
MAEKKAPAKDKAKPQKDEAKPAEKPKTVYVKRR